MQFYLILKTTNLLFIYTNALRCKIFCTLIFESNDNDPLELQAKSRETLNLLHFYVKTNYPSIIKYVYCISQSNLISYSILFNNILNDANIDFYLSIYHCLKKLTRVLVILITYKLELIKLRFVLSDSSVVLHPLIGIRRLLLLNFDSGKYSLYAK